MKLKKRKIQTHNNRRKVECNRFVCVVQSYFSISFSGYVHTAHLLEKMTSVRKRYYALGLVLELVLGLRVGLGLAEIRFQKRAFQKM